jgi:hypothetical protein
MKKGVG